MRHPLDHPALYAFWQAPFERQKLRPVGDLRVLQSAGRVLDVACGPGNHAHLFDPDSYVGIDTNGAYVEHAKRKHSGRFEVADARTYEPQDGARFDLIFANSLLHHLDDVGARAALANLARLLDSGGRLVLMDLVLPKRFSPSRLLARADRGSWPRGLQAWEELIGESFQLQRNEPYDLTLLGIPLWRMIYVEGEPRR